MICLNFIFTELSRSHNIGHEFDKLIEMFFFKKIYPLTLSLLKIKIHNLF